VKLTILDRLSIINILPKEGNFLTLSVSNDITKKVGIGQEESKEIGIKFEENRVSWNPETPEKEVEFSESELSVIRKQLKTLDSQDKLTIELLETYKKLGADEVK